MKDPVTAATEKEMQAKPALASLTNRDRSALLVFIAARRGAMVERFAIELNDVQIYRYQGRIAELTELSKLLAPPADLDT